ncbi:DUF4914 family protein [Phycisphaerales bacterium AB-hyl4]|uniref:DUF4914 family protein n=1 Tax=Natronomicrosphaera hydrolytica TaxID=3242702 RepID=A0ABV4U1X0_9BACT
MATATTPNVKLPAEVEALLQGCRSVTYAESAKQLVELAVPSTDERGYYQVAYDVPGKGMYVEANVCRVRNGISANYTEAYMRRRDPDCMVIGDEKPTNKERYRERFGKPFDELRTQTFDWLKQQDLAVFYFNSGVDEHGLPSMAICPANAGFFALGLAMLQGILSFDEIEDDFEPHAILYVAPPFRHTHFDGKQVVVHNRTDTAHELFSYNLYPGPSAKKGVYGMLLNLGEEEGWVTAHCATVQVVTPYDNVTTIMHEGASGGGKSEMLEHVHRETDGRLRLGTNVVSGESRYLTLPRGCELHPVTDDMALCHPSYQKDGSKKLRLMDAEHSWFLRVNHIDHYGTDPHMERMVVEPSEPLLFLNIDAVPDSRALIWEHIEDEPGKRCPNPRVVVPRDIVPNIVHHPVTVDIRSFGVRCPPCTAENPTYGIVGLFHVLPPALAWLWRLVAPRGHGNPSIVSQEGLQSEGVGSYWPFATGRKVDQANLILNQILDTTNTLFILTPNQHVGAWETSFAPQWITREYLARRGHAPFRSDRLVKARCPLLGYTVKTMQVEGQVIGHWFLQVETQPEVGEQGYDAGAEILREFFHKQIQSFVEDDLHPTGKKIIECCLNGGTVEDYQAFTPNANA